MAFVPFHEADMSSWAAAPPSPAVPSGESAQGPGAGPESPDTVESVGDPGEDALEGWPGSSRLSAPGR